MRIAGCWLLLTAWAWGQQDFADLVLRGGVIATMEPQDAASPTALAVRGDRIVAVGGEREMDRWVGPDTHVMDLKGAFVTPGLIEGHGHFLGLGQARMMLDLRRADSWEAIVAQVQEAAAKTRPGQWIVGRGWHQAKWKQLPQPNVDGYPTHATLSSISPDHPVLLTHASGHMCFANAAAMRLAGVDRQTKSPDGGEILHDSQGEPIGVFREAAQGMIERARRTGDDTLSPEQRRAQWVQAIDLAGKECLSKGLTSFQDAGSPLELLDVYRELAEAHRLPLRLWVMVRDGNQRLAERLPDYRWIDVGGSMLTVRAIKRSIDGALGPHGAWLLEPYDDLPTSRGLNTASPTSLEQTARLAKEHGFQLCVHAIGDRANRETLDLFQRILGSEGAKLRWRIEHAQHLHPTDIPRFAALGVIASMQGVHCTSDAVFVAQRLGMRRASEGAYVWKRLWESGAVISNGTDAPVEDVDPLPSLYATVTRRLPSGELFFPDQCLTRRQALQSYTINAAYAAFEETHKGSLSVGKLADIVVWTKDLLQCPDDELLDARVQYTILGGRVAYAAGRE